MIMVTVIQLASLLEFEQKARRRQCAANVTVGTNRKPLTQALNSPGLAVTNLNEPA